VVSNPHIKRVYNAYFHAFETLRVYPPVKSVADNAAFCTLLRRLVDEHGELLHICLQCYLCYVSCALVICAVLLPLHTVVAAGGRTQ
jgi:hypothetical protein